MGNVASSEKLPDMCEAVGLVVISQNEGKKEGWKEERLEKKQRDKRKLEIDHRHCVAVKGIRNLLFLGDVNGEETALLDHRAGTVTCTAFCKASHILILRTQELLNMCNEALTDAHKCILLTFQLGGLPWIPQEGLMVQCLKV